MERKSQGNVDLTVVAPYLLIMAALAALGVALAGKPEAGTGQAAQIAAPVQADSQSGEYSTGANAQPTDSREGDGNVFMYN